MQYLRAKTLNFNSRPSARGDFPRLPCLTLPFHFNSRPSARGDGSHQRPHQPPEISIHAPPRGATEQPFLDFDFCRFQFTPLREGRPATGRVCLGTNGISIHAPPRGATGYPSQLWCRGLISIHAPPRGATPAPVGVLFIPPCLGGGFFFNFPPRGVGRRPRPGKASGPHLISIHAPPRGATCLPRRRTA